MGPVKNQNCQKHTDGHRSRGQTCGRREFLKGAAAIGGAAILSGCGGMFGSKEELSLQWKDYFKKIILT